VDSNIHVEVEVLCTKYYRDGPLLTAGLGRLGIRNAAYRSRGYGVYNNVVYFTKRKLNMAKLCVNVTNKSSTLNTRKYKLRTKAIVINNKHIVAMLELDLC
jgi:hypothetical protein